MNKCGLSQRTNEEIEGYISSLEKGWGRVSTVIQQVCADLWKLPKATVAAREERTLDFVSGT